MSTPLREEVEVELNVVLQHDIEQFLYREATLLDEHRYEEWLALFADDVQYWAPVRRNVMTDDLASETAGRGEMALFDEDKDSLGWRVRRLLTGKASAEEPPSRTRRLIGNVQIFPTELIDELEVRSNFFVHRNRLETNVETFTGSRVDLLRQDGTGSWQVARRVVYLDQSVLLANSLAIFL